MRNARASTPATRFLGVRLTAEEETLLDQFRLDHGLANRSDAVRALLQLTKGADPGPGELPATVHAGLEDLVEDGYAPDLHGALTLAVTLGISELHRTYVERRSALREHARTSQARREARRRADREGRGLLRR